MTIFIFLCNVVPIRVNPYSCKENKDSLFILIGSKYCLDHLSEENKQYFNEIYQIHQVDRNFHQIDFNEVEKILLSIFKRNNSNKIRLFTNEDSTQLVCAKLREKFNIPGTQSSQILPFFNKIVSKNKLRGKVRIPRFIFFDKKAYQNVPEEYLGLLCSQLNFPMFIKPIALACSVDTYHISNYQSLKIILEQIVNKPWNYEIDEYIEGDLFHCDLVIQEGNIVFFIACKYAWPLAKFLQGHPIGSIPVHDDLLLSQLKNFSKEILNQLGTFSSVFHLEIFRDTKTDQFIFLEAAARSPGSLVPNMYKIMYGQYIDELHYQVQMYPTKVIKLNQSGIYAGWITFPKIKGTLQAINYPNLSIDNIWENFTKPGEKLGVHPIKLRSCLSSDKISYP